MPGRRQDAGTQRSAHLRTRSTPRKKFDQREEPLGSPRPGPRALEEQLADPALGLDQPHRLEVRHDRQRHDDRPRPGRHRAQAEVEPRRDQHQLRRHARALVVADLAEQRQVEPREAVAGLSAAQREDRRPGPHQGRVVGRVAHQLEREVRLDRGADLGRPAGVDRPAAVGELVVENVAGTAVADRVVSSRPGRPAAGCIPIRGSCRLRARRPSGRRRSAGTGASSGSAPARPRARSSQKGFQRERQAMDEVIRGPGGCASLLVGDHAFLTLSLDSRSLVSGKSSLVQVIARQD